MDLLPSSLPTNVICVNCICPCRLCCSYISIIWRSDHQSYFSWYSCSISQFSFCWMSQPFFLAPVVELCHSDWMKSILRFLRGNGKCHPLFWFLPILAFYAFYLSCLKVFRSLKVLKLTQLAFVVLCCLDSFLVFEMGIYLMGPYYWFLILIYLIIIVFLPSLLIFIINLTLGLNYNLE